MSQPNSPDLRRFGAAQTLDSRGTGAVLDGRYRLEHPIGSGGMGHVWRARHLHLDRVVAIKLLIPEMKIVADRLMREAQALARVRHPGIVEVYDCGVLEDGAPYLVMECLIGEPLITTLERGPLDQPVAASLFVTVLDALSAAHQVGIVHRDIKPDNIFLVADSNGSGKVMPKLLDFGIARVEADNLRRNTHAGSMLGTPSYMSPEQFRGHPSDERTDIWGVCATLYETLVGVPPFGFDSMVAIMARVLELPVPFPRNVRLDGKLWSILTKGLRKQPEQRFASAAEMRDALTKWLATRSGIPSAERRSETPPPVDSAPEPVGPPRPPTFDEDVKRKFTGD